MPDPARPALRLPKKLAYTTLGCAIAGVVACSGQTSGGSDASTNLNGYDASTDCDGGSFAYCGGPPCPVQGAYYCSAECPPGCEPFA